MVSLYGFVTKACAKRPGAAISVERRRSERRTARTLLAGAACELAGAARLRLRQAFERMHLLCQTVIGVSEHRDYCTPTTHYLELPVSFESNLASSEPWQYVMQHTL